MVNALAHEMTWKDKSARDRRKMIGLENYYAARERLILSRAIHLGLILCKNLNCLTTRGSPTQRFYFLEKTRLPKTDNRIHNKLKSK